MTVDVFGERAFDTTFSFKSDYFRTIYMFVALYSHLVFLFLYASFSISVMTDQDLLEQIKIGKSNLAKAIMTGEKDLIKKVGFFS